MSTNKKIIPLPESCKVLEETIDIILVTDLLEDGSESAYNIYEGPSGHSCIINIRSFPCDIFVPYNASQYTPPSVIIQEKYLSRLPDKEIRAEFENEIKSLGIIVVKHGYDTKTGYIRLSGVSSSTEQKWHLLLVDQSKLYDLYLLCYKYKLFKNVY